MSRNIHLEECKRAAKRFEADCVGFQMHVVKDDGLHRYLQFRAPAADRGLYWFDLITWPGSLCIDGDMGTYVFRRLGDMFSFFHRTATYGVNASYWAEKLQAPSGRDAVKEFHLDTAIESLQQELDRQLEDESITQEEYGAAFAELRSSFENHRSTAQAIDDLYGYSEITFEDPWEIGFSEYEFGFLWCLHAIVWGIEQYKASTLVRSGDE